MHVRDAKRLARALTILAGCAIGVGLGLLGLRDSLSDSVLGRASYDLPFLWRAPMDTHETTLVYLDDESARQLHQPLDDAWNRALHVQLLNRLAQDHARLVFYDVVFDQPAADPAGDVAFAEAIRQQGKVILGAALEIVQSMGGVKQERILPPIKLLRKAAAGWGLLAFKPVDADYGIRQLFPGTAEIPSATWRAAEALGAPVTRGPRETPEARWINYYGPRNTFASVNFAQALDPVGVPPGYFKDRIVMIGGRSAVGYLSAGRDEFGTPYSRTAHQFSPGIEVHATILLNLLHGEWLTRMPLRAEIVMFVIVGLIAGSLSALRPPIAVVLALAGSVAMAGAACWLVWHQHRWFAWLVPAAVQLPFGLVWSLGSQYLLESRRRKELRRAFGFYLSPQMADRIADSDFDLKPGGKLVEVTVIFTDLENFTTLSEHLDPAEVSEILTSYFGQTTKCILEGKGTIIKYIGDAVFAAWGAPIDEPLHAIRAAEAACVLRTLSDLEVRGVKLRTRVGLHSGKVLAGNLGSTYRFDYTMIGDAVNFASRLESLNKYLSTQVLISDAVHAQLGDGFATRRLGEFRVAGKTQSVVIHELLCRRDVMKGEQIWIERFQEGLQSFRAGDLASARECMTQTKDLRGGRDGPSEFYLRKIAALGEEARLDDWTGVVELTDK